MAQAIGFVVFGIVVGMFSAIFGVGGGLLMVPFLVALGKDPKVATATSLAVIIPTAISGVLREWGERRVDWVVVGLLAAGAIIGPFLGIPLKNALSSLALRRAFGVLLVFVALDMMKLTVGGTELTFASFLKRLFGGT